MHQDIEDIAMSANSQHLRNATAQELEDYLKNYLWRALPNYSGVVYDKHAIIHMLHDESTIEDKANFATIEKEMTADMKVATFKHYRYGDLQMILVPLNAPYETLRYAAVVHADLMAGEILDPIDLADAEEEQIELLWANMTPNEREQVARDAGKNDHEAIIERTQEMPDMMHPETVEILHQKIYTG
jgi:hypothetical protein